MEKVALRNNIKIKVSFNGSVISEKIFSKQPISIGREATSDVVLDYGFISRKHSEIIEDQGICRIIDLNSRNGLYVDGVQGRIFDIKNKIEFQINLVTISILIANEKNEFAEEQTVSKSKRVDVQQTQSKKVLLQQAKSTGILPRLFEDEEEVVEVGTEVAVENEYVLNYKPLIKKNIKNQIIGLHPLAHQVLPKNLEAVVVWHDEIIEVKEFEQNETVKIGPSIDSDLRIPLLKSSWVLANSEFTDTTYNVYKGLQFSHSKNGQDWYENQSPANQSFKLSHGEIVKFHLAPWLKIYLRYIPAQRRLTSKKLSEPDKDLQKAVVMSAVIHFVLSLSMMFFSPKAKVFKPPVLNERLARLLVPPKPVVIPPEPKVEPKPIAEIKKKPEIKPLVKEKKTPQKIIQALCPAVCINQSDNE